MSQFSGSASEFNRRSWVTGSNDGAGEIVWVGDCSDAADAGIANNNKVNRGYRFIISLPLFVQYIPDW